MIKVLRSSMLVQGVLLARLTADTVGQRAQLSPWVSLKLKCKCGTPALPSGQAEDPRKLQKYADSCKVDASIILGLGRTKCCAQLQSVGVGRLRQQATDLRSSGSYLVCYSLNVIICCGVRLTVLECLEKISIVTYGRKRPDILRTMGKTLLHNPIIAIAARTHGKCETPFMLVEIIVLWRAAPSQQCNANLAVTLDKTPSYGLWLSENLVSTKQQPVLWRTPLAALSISRSFWGYWYEKEIQSGLRSLPRWQGGG